MKNTLQYLFSVIFLLGLAVIYAEPAARAEADVNLTVDQEARQEVGQLCEGAGDMSPGQYNRLALATCGWIAYERWDTCVGARPSDQRLEQCYNWLDRDLQNCSQAFPFIFELPKDKEIPTITWGSKESNQKQLTTIRLQRVRELHLVHPIHGTHQPEATQIGAQMTQTPPQSTLSTSRFKILSRDQLIAKGSLTVRDAQQLKSLLGEPKVVHKARAYAQRLCANGSTPELLYALCMYNAYTRMHWCTGPNPTWEQYFPECSGQWINDWLSCEEAFRPED